MSQDVAVSHLNSLPNQSNEVAAPPLSVPGNTQIKSPLFAVSHQYYDNEKKPHVKKDFSLFSSICKPCDAIYQKPCRYGTRDCLYYKLNLETSGSKVSGNSNSFQTSYKKNKFLRSNK